LLAEGVMSGALRIVLATCLLAGAVPAAARAGRGPAAAVTRTDLVRLRVTAFQRPLAPGQVARKLARQGELKKSAIIVAGIAPGDRRTARQQAKATRTLLRKARSLGALASASALLDGIEALTLLRKSPNVSAAVRAEAGALELRMLGTLKARLKLERSRAGAVGSTATVR
jgi:hypothetical protein